MRRREFVYTVAISAETVAGDVLSPSRARLWPSQTPAAEPPRPNRGGMEVFASSDFLFTQIGRDSE